MAIEIVPSGKALGAEIRGVDLAAGIDDATFASVRDAFLEHSVVVLRGQRLSIPEQRDFCSRFGPPEEHATQFTVPGYRDVLCVSNIVDGAGKPIGITDAGRAWHTDGHFEERPTMYSMLYAVEVPHDEEGRPLGATMFASTADAYDTLPDSLKGRLDGLKADNTMKQIYRYFRAHGLASKRPPLTEAQEQLLGVHPVVRTHPVTGRKCIYVSSAHTERIHGLPEEESRDLVNQLQEHCIRDERVYRHEWQVGDLVMWDNCATQHCAIGDYTDQQRRLMYRVSVEGLPTA
jgi:taurine dioxygenase